MLDPFQVFYLSTQIDNYFIDAKESQYDRTCLYPLLQRLHLGVGALHGRPHVGVVGGEQGRPLLQLSLQPVPGTGRRRGGGRGIAAVGLGVAASGILRNRIQCTRCSFPLRGTFNI